jgi:diguanylate cyclase (GGDEF)-like protein
VESYARIAALWLHDETALDDLLAGARHDALTGCLSYGATRSELDREIGRSSRNGRSLACCFIDLDGFKQVNDRLGHLRGSQVLAEMGSILRSELRIGDSVGRYGGDEFLVVLPDTDGEAARAFAERLRRRICAMTKLRTHETIDASIGVAQWRAGATADDLLAAADGALLFAKRSGGGSVMGAHDVAAGVGRGVVGGESVNTRGTAWRKEAIS